jgi:hypothetical protein
MKALFFFVHFAFISLSFAGEKQVKRCSDKKLTSIERAAYWDETYMKSQYHLEILEPLNFLQTGDVLIEPSDEFASSDGENNKFVDAIEAPENYLNTLHRFNAGWSHAVMVYRDEETNEVFLMDSFSSDLGGAPYSDDDLKFIRKKIGDEALLKNINKVKREGGEKEVQSLADVEEHDIAFGINMAAQDNSVRDSIIKERLKDPNFLEAARKRTRENTQTYLRGGKYVVLRPRRDLDNRDQLIANMGEHLKKLFGKDILFNVKEVEAYKNTGNDPNSLVPDSDIAKLAKSYENEDQLLKHCTERVVDSLLVSGIRKVFSQPSLVDVYMGQIEAIRIKFNSAAAEKAIAKLNRKIQLSLLIAAFEANSNYLDINNIDEMNDDQLNKAIDEKKSKLGMKDYFLFSSLQGMMRDPNRKILASLEGLLQTTSGGSFFPNVFYDDLMEKSTYSEDNPKGGVFTYAGSIGACTAEANGIVVDHVSRAGVEFIDINNDATTARGVSSEAMENLSRTVN